MKYNQNADVIQPLAKWDSLSESSVKEAVMNLKTRGGTTLSVGMNTLLLQLTYLGMRSGSDLFHEVLKDPENARYENRLIYLTGGSYSCNSYINIQIWLPIREAKMSMN